LCKGDKGLSYANSLIHRVVENSYIQGGDIDEGSRGNSGRSIFGCDFEMENFSIKHNQPGIIGLCNYGQNTQNSQF